jgi:hypothetical protein
MFLGKEPVEKFENAEMVCLSLGFKNISSTKEFQLLHDGHFPSH